MALPEDPALRIVTDAQFDAHADRHAADGPDRITPESIGALLAVATPDVSGHVDNILEPGTHRILEADATVENGYPSLPDAFTVLYLQVEKYIKTSDAYFVQHLYDQSGRSAWMRTRYGVWGSWRRQDPGGAVDAGDPRMYDSGWRDISGLLDPIWTVTPENPAGQPRFVIRRMGENVRLSARIYPTTSATGSLSTPRRIVDLISLDGFRFDTAHVYMTHAAASYKISRPAWITGSYARHSLHVLGWGLAEEIDPTMDLTFSMTWTTADVLPDVLPPGSPY